MSNDVRTGEIVPRTEAAIVPVDFGHIVQSAIEKGIDAEGLSKLLDVFERVKAGQAKEAFAAGMTAFKARCPQIERRTENTQFTVTRYGVKVPRKFASTQDIGAQTKDLLSECGLSYRWGDAVINGGMMTIACIVRHVGGHEESSSSTIPIESSAGASPQQKYGIAEAYAMRYSLKKALGLTECDEDDDGNDPGQPADTITEHEAANLDALIDEIGGTTRAGFLKVYTLEKVGDLPRSMYRGAVGMLEQKRGAKR